MNIVLRSASVLVGVAVLAGCADHPAGPAKAPRLSASQAAGVPFTEGLASPRWQETARNLVVQARLGPIPAGHAYPLLGVAQYLAVQRAEAAAGGTDVNPANASGNGMGAGGRARLQTDPGALAGAAVVVLSHLV